MKSFLFFVMFFAFTSSFLAQENIPQGTFNLAGSLSFSSTSTEGSDESHSIILLSPQVGYFFLDNISLSLLVQYSSNSLGSYDNTQWALGPSLRYYLPLEKVYPFLELSYLYSKSSNSSDDVWKDNIFMIAGGIDYFLNEYVAIESNISYSFQNTQLPESYEPYYTDLSISQNTFRIGIGLNVFIK